MHKTIQDWVAQYGDDMYRWAFHKTGDKEAAEDIVQETFLGAFKSMHTFQGKSQPKTWLFSILNNKIVDYHRKRFRELTVSESKLSQTLDDGDALDRYFDSDGRWIKETSPVHWNDLSGELLDDLAFRGQLDQCMKNLPSKWFSAIHLKYLEEKNGKEICQELGITPSNFWQILHRAKLQLRSCLEKTGINHKR